MPDALPGLRASHADRDRVVDALRVASGDDRSVPRNSTPGWRARCQPGCLASWPGRTADLPLVPAAEGKDVLVVEQHGETDMVHGKPFIVSSPGP
jgi:hypothetical protein